MGVYLYMLLFSHTKKDERFGVIIDLGSGSAMVAVVVSKIGAETPTILWAKREVASLRNIENLHESSKSVMTALVNVLLEFETDGRQALQAYAPGAKFSTIQCSIAAPWSYTVSKKIHYSQDEPFEVSQELLEELTNAAEAQTKETLKEHEVANELGLTITSKATLHTIVNGYRVKNPRDKTATDLILVHTSVVVHSYLLDALKEIKQKVFFDTPLSIFSYALMYNCVSADLYQKGQNVALIDVTYEATEITIVRDGVLSYVTHTPYGLYSLARELAIITGDPLHEALKHLEEGQLDAYVERQPNSRQEEIETLFNSYIAKLQKLLKETGDELAAPRHMVLHTGVKTESLFSELLTTASKQASRTSPVIQPITSLLQKKFKTNESIVNSEDTAMLLAAQFYHTGNHCLTLKTF